MVTALLSISFDCNAHLQLLYSEKFEQLVVLYPVLA